MAPDGQDDGPRGLVEPSWVKNVGLHEILRFPIENPKNTLYGAHGALFGGSLGRLEELMGSLGRSWGDLDGSREALETPCELHVAPAREIQRFYGPIKEPIMLKVRRGGRPARGRGVPGRGRGGVINPSFRLLLVLRAYRL